MVQNWLTAWQSVLLNQADWLETWSLCGVEKFSKPNRLGFPDAFRVSVESWREISERQDAFLCGVFDIPYVFQHRGTSLWQMFAQVSVVHLHNVIHLIPFSMVCLSCCVHLLRRNHRASIVAAHHSDSSGFLVCFWYDLAWRKSQQRYSRYTYVYTIRIYVQPAKYPFNVWKESFILRLAAILKSWVC